MTEQVEEQTRQQGTARVKYLYEVHLIYMGTESLYRSLIRRQRVLYFSKLRRARLQHVPVELVLN